MVDDAADGVEVDPFGYLRNLVVVHEANLARAALICLKEVRGVEAPVLERKGCLGVDFAASVGLGEVRHYVRVGACVRACVRACACVCVCERCAVCSVQQRRQRQRTTTTPNLTHLAESAMPSKRCAAPIEEPIESMSVLR